MKPYNHIKIISALLLSSTIAISSCKVPALTTHKSEVTLPHSFNDNVTSSNDADINWKNYFADPYLQSLIDTGLQRNIELLTTLQEITIAQNEVKIKKGKINPKADFKIGAGVDKPGRYTSQGAGDASTEIAPGLKMPDPLTDLNIGAVASWEVDIWKKLRNAKDAAVNRFLATQEGRNFVMTNLVAEIANSYYELLALDNQMDILQQNIKLQKDALEVVKIQKQASRTTELAVQKFQAEVYKTESMQYEIQQEIVIVENRINALLNRTPQTIQRSSTSFLDNVPQMVNTGLPSELLLNRPDIRQAELNLKAAALDVKVARAEFYPSFEISSFIGLQSFNPSYLVKMPESIAFSLVGDLVGPLINKSAIKAEFNMANARQLQSLYDYDKTVINAYLEVATNMALIKNLNDNYNFKSKQVLALTQSIDIANELFKYARADYLEVLMTQRDVLEAKMELVETQRSRMNAVVNMYRNLGGGWK